MAATGDLLLPLALVCLLLISSGSALPTRSQTPGSSPTRAPGEALWPSTEDYDQPEDGPTRSAPEGTSPHGRPARRCDYNACAEGQVACTAQEARSNCLCPGFTPRSVPPEAPSLRSVSWNGSEVVAHWCAPNSHVTSYAVTVDGQHRQRFRESQRSGGLGHVDGAAQVCVAAVNQSGAGAVSCMTYNSGGGSLPLKAGLIGGALGFLLLLLLAVALWRHKRKSKQEAGISMHDTAGAR